LLNLLVRGGGCGLGVTLRGRRRLRLSLRQRLPRVCCLRGPLQPHAARVAPRPYAPAPTFKVRRSGSWVTRRAHWVTLRACKVTLRRTAASELVSLGVSRQYFTHLTPWHMP
jgi:hypothetical protein